MAPIRKSKTFHHINNLPQRSSLRRAIKESLQGAVVVTAAASIAFAPYTSSQSNQTTSSVQSPPSKLSSSSLPTKATQQIRQTIRKVKPMPTVAASSCTSSTAQDSGIDDINVNDDDNDDDDDDAVNESGHPNGIPTRRKGWYRVKEIIHEALMADSPVYLVEWEGCDPKTHALWPSSWVNAQDVSASAIREWEAKKPKGNLMT